MVTAGNLVADAVGCGRSRDGGMWLLLGRELRKYREGTEVSRFELSQRPGGFWSMTEDSRGNVWVSTYDKGLCQVAPDRSFQRWTTTNGLPADGVRFVFEDRENNVWIGTSGGGLTRFKPPARAQFRQGTRPRGGGELSVFGRSGRTVGGYL